LVIKYNNFIPKFLSKTNFAQIDEILGSSSNIIASMVSSAQINKYFIKSDVDIIAQTKKNELQNDKYLRTFLKKDDLCKMY